MKKDTKGRTQDNTWGKDGGKYGGNVLRDFDGL